MGNSLPILVAGGGLIILGLFLIRHHGVVWARQQGDSSLPADDVEFFRRQYRRRVQTSGLLTLIGLLMLVGDVTVIDKKNAVAFLIWLIALLLLVLWVLILAMLDWLAIRAHTQAALIEVRMQQMALEREAKRLQREHRGGVNGQGDPSA